MKGKIHQQQKKPRGARTTIPGNDGGKGGERWWRFTGGRCTTETVWGNSVFIHWTNYLWEWVRGISQHPLVLSFSPCLSFSANNSGKNNNKKKNPHMRGTITVWKHIKIGLKNQASLTSLISGMSLYSEIKYSNRSIVYILC